MPESILTFCESSSLLNTRDVHRSIIQTYQDDFAKYSREPSLSRIHTVFNAITRTVGEKVKYVNISREDRAKDFKQAIELLTKARLLLPTYHSNCSGIPIKSGINEKIYKLYFLDIGLLNFLNRARQKQKVQTVNYKLLSLPLYLVDVMHDASLKVLNEE